MKLVGRCNNKNTRHLSHCYKKTGSRRGLIKLLYYTLENGGYIFRYQVWLKQTTLVQLMWIIYGTRLLHYKAINIAKAAKWFTLLWCCVFYCFFYVAPRQSMKKLASKVAATAKSTTEAYTSVRSRSEKWHDAPKITCHGSIGSYGCYKTVSVQKSMKIQFRQTSHLFSSI